MTSLRERLDYEPQELNFGTSGLRGLVTDMTDLECYINTVGFLRFMATKQEYSNGSVYIAGDLRSSTPHIMAAVTAAIEDNGYKAVNCGLIPTPALAHYALLQNAPCVMITGSHIPADRNGIKFYKLGGEVMKSDEASIKQVVAEVRTELYQAESLAFASDGSLLALPELPAAILDAEQLYIDRYEKAFANEPLKDKKVVVYQHSAVGRDLLVTILESLGAEVVTTGRSDVFIPIDSENVTLKDRAYFQSIAAENENVFGIVSTDGDSDRPFVIDGSGQFHRGDELGLLIAEYLNADFVAVPISSNDAVGMYLSAQNIPFAYTKIGSPYVIEAMQESNTVRPVSWEPNGGFIIGKDMTTGDGAILKALPTRDAILPIIVALISAAKASISLSALFEKLPKRFTSSGLIDNFPIEISKKMVARFSNDTEETKADLASYFTPKMGYGEIQSINSLDGTRLYFTNGLIAHIRPSSNAPQLRIYSVADTQSRADEIVEQCISEPNGIFRTIEASLE